MSEAGETTPPDAQSLVSDDAISTIVDLSMPNMEHHSMPGASSSTGVSAAGANAGFDKRDEFIATLQHDLEMERETKEQLIQASHSPVTRGRNALVFENEARRVADERAANPRGQIQNWTV
jgi:hypothetical protein